MKSERHTRQQMIDLQLGRAGWSSGSRQLIEEFLVETIGVIRNSPHSFRVPFEFVDYVLFDRLGRLLAIVEAKRSSRDPLVGERQAAEYADALFAKYGVDPFVFLANGDEIWFWHRKLYPPRKVSGFSMRRILPALRISASSASRSAARLPCRRLWIALTRLKPSKRLRNALRRPSVASLWCLRQAREKPGWLWRWSSSCSGGSASSECYFSQIVASW